MEITRLHRQGNVVCDKPLHSHGCLKIELKYAAEVWLADARRRPPQSADIYRPNNGVNCVKALAGVSFFF